MYDFDEQVVRLHKDFADLADRFVRVRLTKIDGVDLRLFEFDYDVNWFVFFLNADETIYGRYGGRDATDPESRISFQGLRSAMAHALKAHQNPPPAEPRANKLLKARDFPAARTHKGCVHCHNVNEFRRAAAKAAGTLKRADFWVYPLPENVGLTLDIDAGDLVKAVAEGSPAASVGMEPGDRVRSVDGRSVASIADVSFALHKAPAIASVPITWERDGRQLSGKMVLVDGWKRTNVTWRPSMLDLLPAVPFGGGELSAAERKALGILPGQAAFRETAQVHKSLAASGIRPGDVIVGVDGKTVDGEIGDLLGYVRKNQLIGDAITFDVIRDGKRIGVRHVLK